MTIPESPQTPEDAAVEEQEPESGKGLRAQLEATQAELRELKERALDDAFGRNGLSRTSGVGKAFAQSYDGEPTPEAVAEYLQAEYQFEAEPEAHPFAQAIARGQAELDALHATGGSVAPMTHADELARAEARGDTDTSIALKSDQLSKMFGR